MLLKVVRVLAIQRSLNSNKECGTDNLPVKLIRSPEQFISWALGSIHKVRTQGESDIQGGS